MGCKYCAEYEDLPEHVINGEPAGRVFDTCIQCDGNGWHIEVPSGWDVGIKFCPYCGERLQHAGCDKFSCDCSRECDPDGCWTCQWDGDCDVCEHRMSCEYMPNGRTIDRYISAGELLGKLDKLYYTKPYMHEGESYYTGISDAMQQLNDCSIADVVEVVRCVDCKHCKVIRHDVGDATWHCSKAYGLPDVDPTDFCSKGERREYNG